MNIQTVTEYEVRVLSLPLIGSLDPNFCSIDHDRFKAKFGVTTELCAKTWNLMVANLRKNHVDLSGYRLNPVHILYALFFLRCYPTARQTVGTLGHSLSLVTFRRYAYLVVRQIAALSEEVVRWYTLQTKNIQFNSIHYLPASFSFTCRFYGQTVSKTMLATNKKSLLMVLTSCVSRQMMEIDAVAGGHTS